MLLGDYLFFIDNYMRCLPTPIPGHPSSSASASRRLEEVAQRLQEEKEKNRRKSITEDEDDDESSSLPGFLDSPDGEYFQYLFRVDK